MRQSFIKMHGAGNDYVFVDGFLSELPESPDRVAVKISNRNYGIGSDGLILLVPPSAESHDVEMRMWNADGSIGDTCGNGLRCVALWMHLQQRVGSVCRVRTRSGIVTARIEDVNTASMTGTVTVDMGHPQLEFSGAIQTLSADYDPEHTGLLTAHVDQVSAAEILTSVQESNTFSNDETAITGHGQMGVQFTAVSMGNPHAVIFGHELTDHNVLNLGRLIQQHARFPDSVNVEWVDVVSDRELTVRVLERGSGETLACGSGACAVVVAGVLRGHCGRDQPVRVRLPGGVLTVKWTSSGHVLLTGPACVSFTGEWVFEAEKCSETVAFSLGPEKSSDFHQE